MEKGEKRELRVWAEILIDAECVGAGANGAVFRVDFETAKVQPFELSDHANWMTVDAADYADGRLLFIGSAHLDKPAHMRKLS